MFRLPDHLLVGKCNTGRIEPDVTTEIQHILAGMTFVDGAPLGYGCSWPHDPDGNAEPKTRRSLPAMRIDSPSTAAR